MHLGTEGGLGLHKKGFLIEDLGNLVSETMDGEDKKSGLKKRLKPVGIGLDSDDDEPIGSFFKSRRPRNSKKVKSGLESGGEGGKKVEVGEEKLAVGGGDLGGMDDTLASFKKKLKGPKKDSGSGILRGRSSALNVADSSDRSSNGPVEDVEKGRVMGGDEGSDVTMDAGVEYKCKGKVKRPNINSMAKTVDDHVDLDNDLESMGSGCNNLREVESGLCPREGPNQSVDEHLEDSLSELVRKSQSGLIKKSWVSSSLKQKREAQTLEDGLSPCSESPVGFLKHVTVRRLGSDAASKLECNSLKSKNKRSDDSFCEVSDCIEENNDSTRGLPSASAIKEEIMRPSDNGHDRSSKLIFEDPPPRSPSSRSPSKGIQNEAMEDPCGSNAQEGYNMDNDSLNEVCDGEFSCVQLNSAHSHKAAMGTRTFKDKLKHCSTVNSSTLVHDVVNMPNPISGPEKMEEDNGFGKGESNRGFRDSLTQQSEGVPTMHVSNADLEISPSLVQKESLVTYHDDGLLKESCRYTPNDICNSVSRKNLEVSLQCISLHSSPHVVKVGETCRDGDGINTCTEEPDLASDSMQKEHVIVSDVQLSPRVCNLGLAFQMDLQEKNLETCLYPNKSFLSIQKCSSTLHQNQPSDDASKGICVPSHDYCSVNEEGNGASPPSITRDENENYPEDATSVPDCENKDGKLSTGQRAARKPKKRRHGDMAYEGDADWDILLSAQGFLESHGVVDSEHSFRTRAKCDTSSNISVEAENGNAAAVSAGLKAHAAGPVEKIKFKEVLKRKGGLQEYLECRLVIFSETWLYAVVFLDAVLYKVHFELHNTDFMLFRHPLKKKKKTEFFPMVSQPLNLEIC